jgi:hypothetical protein
MNAAKAEIIRKGMAYWHPIALQIMAEKRRKISMDNAIGILKLITTAKPEKAARIWDNDAFDNWAFGYNQALNDYEAALLAALKGRENE